VQNLRFLGAEWESWVGGNGSATLKGKEGAGIPSVYICTDGDRYTDLFCYILTPFFYLYVILYTKY